VVVNQGRRFDLPADRTSPRAARQVAVDVARRCGVDEHAVALCVTEAVTNAVVHAYRGTSAPGDVVLELVPHNGDGLDVTVRDHGHGLAPRSDSPGAGLGMSLIAAMADRVEIDTSTHGTRVSMHFQRTA
jgi:anti-sigma regulatory factor (Ser/Thr protein kinase)